MLYTSNTKQAETYIKRCLDAGLVPYLLGSPGSGKSALVKAIAKEADLQLIDVRLTAYDSVDLTGYPVIEDGIAKHVPFDVFPTTNAKKKGNGWLLFLDELGQCDPDVQKAAYRLVLDRQVGQYDLHPDVYIVAAGNHVSDMAYAAPLSTALESRMVTITIEVDTDTWIENVAIPYGYDSRIIAFLNYRKESLMTFDPNAEDKKYASPRGWEFMSKLIKDRQVTVEDMPLYAGVIGQGVASDFNAFIQVYQELPKLSEIIKDPEQYPVPDKINLRWATVMHMVDNITDKNIGALFQYIKRFTVDFRILFFKASIAKNPDIEKMEEYRQAMIEFGKYIHGK